MSLQSRLDDSPASIARKFLVGGGVGSEPASSGTKGAWPIHSGVEPDQPADVITVIDTEGVSDARFMTDGDVQTHHGLMFLVRSSSRQSGFSKAEALREFLLDSSTAYQKEVTLSGRTYLIHCFARVSRPNYVGKESQTSERVVHTVNCTVAVTQRP